MKILTLATTMVLLAPAALPVGAFDLRPPDSRVEFVVKDNRGGFTGETREVSGTVTVRERDGGYAADVEAKVDARTIRTGATLRDAQMRSPAFLNTTAFPFITFSGTVTVGGPAPPQFKGATRGRLSIKNVTRDVEVPIEITVEGNTYTARGEVVVKFTDFGLPIPRFLIFVAEDSILIRLQVRLRPKGPSS